MNIVQPTCTCRAKRRQVQVVGWLYNKEKLKKELINRVVLADSEIEALVHKSQLLEKHDPQNIQNCCYILRVGKVFQSQTGDEEVIGLTSNSQGKGKTRKVVYEIGPSETKIVKTLEYIKMPDNICATYSPLYRLSSKGVMLLNASIVEPGYEGPLSCFLVNFSSERVTFFPEDDIAKMIFHKLDNTPVNLKRKIISETNYERDLAMAAKKYHQTFLDVTSISEKAAENAEKKLKTFALSTSVTLILIVAFATAEPLLSKWLYERTGIYTLTQRIEDTKLLKDLQNAELLAKIEELKLEVQKLKSTQVPGKSK
ncbi:hypothetical protein COW36_21150 [bacterium (Candidatus Blackallbacteria) CG17_big_fil_post_rev_8_21_14_2_50_48_46]|uniref:Uncharacterized protein n=1 Tax=bacterium (Candidatus Blackallbacteria) CG17_big_fil_post_rev_8_21_14_2_50_48_46 TaxID=2014261 RepID=A0A2M7FZ16_9BACT|nr:MAG: hypothetical protein COW64_14460 [bacterium (Candidatus Blackallbacteria) CG18_big_fil_WC_8_21_14_2_50_49_26]PIW14548.1 MAG: hypothetical protein COW36_21150 [bacterium (Candidatus Blackallbacteria) CG17_big_fil_post_rev_8_21_14_2_50_48_46]PIW47233.1 MAG: hypothetical protein COW20_13595 [bacterium (Candidatus Blackallbacteria) CG13_big_fil_rev_8_21_14_2_50_49_14]